MTTIFDDEIKLKYGNITQLEAKINNETTENSNWEAKLRFQGFFLSFFSIFVSVLPFL
jgi:hypothetical protein